MSFLSDFLSEDNTNVRNFVLGHAKHHQDMSRYLFEAFAKKKCCPKFVFLYDFLSEDNTNVRNFVLGHSKYHQDMSRYIFEAFAKKKVCPKFVFFCLIFCPKTTQMSQILS